MCDVGIKFQIRALIKIPFAIKETAHESSGVVYLVLIKFFHVGACAN